MFLVSVADQWKGMHMQNSGESEYGDDGKTTNRLTLSFWQSFLLTFAGAAGLISMVADGPLWISVSGFSVVIVLLFWLIVSQRRDRTK